MKLPTLDTPGLVSREIVQILSDNKAVVVEKWDLTVPGCPYIPNPWRPPSIDPVSLERKFEVPMEWIDSLTNRS